jgi:hypothetical protein
MEVRQMIKRNAQRVNVKVLAAAIGAGGVVAMGALTMVVGAAEGPATGPTVADGPTMAGAGSTVTQSYAQTSQPAAASPTMKATAFVGGDWSP